jgi:hypothetical protein
MFTQKDLTKYLWITPEADSACFFARGIVFTPFEPGIDLQPGCEIDLMRLQPVHDRRFGVMRVAPADQAGVRKGVLNENGI